MLHYQINPDSEMPIYRQLVEQINAEIRSGALPCGTQLPTVREMAERLHLSCGTVKHVYDCLQEMGDIEMTRRRGTFVKYVRRGEDSRKHQAMVAIDHMMKKLLELNFSPAEIQIFLNLKMREWGLKWSGIRMTVVTEYTEMAAVMEKQLQQIGNVHVNVCALGQVKEYPYIIDEQSDVILTSVQDGQNLSYLLPDSSKVIRVAFQLAAADAAAISACTAEKIGIWSESEALTGLIRPFVRQGAQLVRVHGALAEELGALIVPCGLSTEELPPFNGQLIRISYQLDAGSMLYLEERINKIRDERQQWPGMLRL
ncbi:MAG: GntR family transcriptional regulator [Clostridia bacterium]|nr:GntR family transcriptional regulator [Clostridia bacterium]